MKFEIGDKVLVESPGAWFDGRKGIISGIKSKTEALILIDIRFPWIWGESHPIRDNVGVGFKPWELRKVEN